MEKKHGPIAGCAWNDKDYVDYVSAQGALIIAMRSEAFLSQGVRETFETFQVAYAAEVRAKDNPDSSASDVATAERKASKALHAYERALDKEMQRIKKKVVDEGITLESDVCAPRAAEPPKPPKPPKKTQEKPKEPPKEKPKEKPKAEDESGDRPEIGEGPKCGGDTGVPCSTEPAPAENASQNSGDSLLGGVNVGIGIGGGHGHHYRDHKRDDDHKKTDDKVTDHKTDKDKGKDDDQPKPQ